MKRFLIIFAIAFGSLVLVLGGVVGIKYLAGEFNTPVIMPEDIVFEQDDYYLDGINDTYSFKIQTTTEGTTENKVRLTFSNGGVLTSDKKHVTDGNITIPVEVEIGKPFDVQIVKDKSHVELGDINWTHGGISKILASSQNVSAKYAITNVFVDVPVYKTELVLFANDYDMAEENDLEYSQMAVVVNETCRPSVSAGQDLYFGVKFYPAASAFKYSSLNSTNFLVNFKDEIIQLINNFNFDNLEGNFEDYDIDSFWASFLYLFGALSTDSVSNDGAQKITYQNYFNSYDAINDLLKTILGTTKYNSLIEDYSSGVKYTNIVEKLVNNEGKLQFIERLAGTNVYKFKALETMGEVDLYSYAFKNITKQNEILTANTENLLTIMAEGARSGYIHQTISGIEIVDVDVNEIDIYGRISNIITNTIHTIYPSEIGENGIFDSYLKIKLSNSNMPTVDLQEKTSNLAIRFERKGGDVWVDADDDICFYNDYELIEDETGKQFRLLGNNNSAWIVYARQAGAYEYRAVIKYFAFDEQGNINFDDDGKTTQILSLKDVKLPIFTIKEVSTTDESNIYWTDVSPIKMTVVNLIDSNGDLVTENPEKDLSKIIHVEKSNAYQTVRYFIYTDDVENEDNLNEYFETNSGEPLEQTLYDGKTRKLFELTSSIIKLKSIENIPMFDINVLFATVKFNFDASNTYEIVKISTTNDVMAQISEIKLTYIKSLNNISGFCQISDYDNAGIVGVEGETIVKVASGASSVLELSISSSMSGDSMIAGLREAYENGNIQLVAKQNMDSPANYITLASEYLYVPEEDALGNITKETILVKASTVDIDDDISVRFYLIYSVGGKNYIYPINFVEGVDIFDSIMLIADTDNTVEFAILKDGSGALLDLEQLKMIEINYELVENEIVVVYYYVLIDGDTGELTRKIADRSWIFNESENRYIRVYVKNFLGAIIDSDNWYLQSSDNSVIKIGGESNKQIIPVGKSSNENGTNILLRLIGQEKTYGSISFKVGDTGRIESCIVNDRNGARAIELIDNAIVNAITANFDGSGEIKLKEEGNELLQVLYKTSDDTEPALLSFDISIAENSRNNYSILTGSHVYNNISSIKLINNLGTDISIGLIYYHSDLDITINVTVILDAVVLLDSYEIQDSEENKIQNVDALGDVPCFRVYADCEYSILAKLNTLGQVYYWDKDYENSLVDNNGKFSFNSSIANTKVRMFISDDNSSGFELGKLYFAIDFEVLSNIKLTETIKNGDFSVRLDEDGKYNVNIYDVIKRVNGDAEFEMALLSIVSLSDNVIVTMHASGNTFDISCKQMVNSEDAYLKLSYGKDNPTVFNFKINISTYSYEKEGSTNICYYDNEKAILLIKGDKIVDVIKAQFENNDITESFELTDIQGETALLYYGDGLACGIDSQLLCDTGCYVIVYDNVGNLTKYKIIVSQINYLFSTYKIANGEGQYPLKDLDIYKAIYYDDGLYDYYVENGIYFGDYIGWDGNIDNENEYDLTDLFNDSYFTKLESIKYGIINETSGSININDFIDSSLDNKKFKIKSVGFDDLVIKITFNYKNGTATYSIPRLIKIKQSQKLIVKYTYDDRDFLSEEFMDEYGIYGSDDYDEQMLYKNNPFTEMPYEYYSFGTKNSMVVDLSVGQVAVYKIDGSEELDYNEGYTVCLEKLAIQFSGVYTFVEFDKENPITYGDYVRFNEDNNLLVTVYKNGLSALRLKLKIMTKYGASEYYYVEVSETSKLIRLGKQYLNGENPVIVDISGSDSLEVQYQDMIYVGGDSNPALGSSDVYYFLYDMSQNNDELKITTTSEYGEVAVDGHSLRIKIAPNGAEFYAYIYSRYGILMTLSIRINPYFTAIENNTDNLYGGVEYELSKLVDIKDKNNNPVAGVLIDNGATFSSNHYAIADNKIIFENKTSVYNINSMVLNLQITIDGEPCIFTFELTNLKIYPGITKTLENYSFETRTISEDGKITLSTDEIIEAFVGREGEVAGLFNFYVKVLNFGGDDVSQKIDLYLKYGNDIQKFTNLSDGLVFDIGPIIEQKTITIELIVCLLNDETEEYSIETVAQKLTSDASLRINPYYTVITNYSQPNDNTSFNCEYIPVNSKIDLSKNNFNGDKRVHVYKTDDELMADISYDMIITNSVGDLLLDTKNGIIDEGLITHEEQVVGFLANGNYDIKIILNDRVYKTFKVSVGDYYAIGSVKVDGGQTLNVDGRVFYAGFGEDNAFNYIDITFFLPDNLPIATGDTFAIVYKDPEGNYSELCEKLANVYYKSSEASRKYRSVISLDQLNDSIKEDNIYIKYKNGLDDEFVRLQNVKFYNRYSILYNNEFVKNTYYSQILKIDNAELREGEKTSLGEYIYDQRVLLNSEYISAISGENVLKNVTYYAKCDIIIDNLEQGGENYDIQLNANEYVNGLSMVELFDIKDSTGNMFWYNNVKEEYESLRLSYEVSTMPDYAMAVRIESREFQQSSKYIVYDYNLKALGATNDGTIITFKLVYKVNDIEFEQYLKILVLPDVRYELRNSDGSDTPNDKYNPLELYALGNYNLVDVNQSSAVLSPYFYVYAYGEYRENKSNLAQTFNITVDGTLRYYLGEDEHGEKVYNYYVQNAPKYYRTSSNGSIFFDYIQSAEIGNKEVTITFEDDYGFSFVYYIVLVASTRIQSINNSREQVFEGDEIAIGNVADSSSTGRGVLISLLNNNNEQELSKIKLVDVYLINNGSYAGIFDERNIVAVNTSNDSITFNYIDPLFSYNDNSYNFWGHFGNGKVVRIDVAVEIKLEGQNETCIINLSFNFTKRYELGINEEDTYVRDGMPFNIANYVSVYDYKTDTSLGQPELYDAEAIKAEFELNNDFVFGYDGENYDEFVLVSRIELVNTAQKVSIEVPYRVKTFNVSKIMKCIIGKESLENLTINDFEILRAKVEDSAVVKDKDHIVFENLFTYNDSKLELGSTEEEKQKKINSIIGQDNGIAKMILAELGIMVLEGSNFGVSLVVNIQNKFSGVITQTEQTFVLEYVNKTKMEGEQEIDDVEKSYFATKSGIVNNYIVLGEHQADQNLQDITFRNSSFALIQAFNSQEVSNKSDNAKKNLYFYQTYTKEGGEEYYFDLNSAINQKNIKLLDISISDGCDRVEVITKITDGDDTFLHTTTVSSSTTSISAIALVSDEIVDKEIELFTGFFTKTDNQYTISNDSAEGTECFNGLTLEDVKLAKNIKKIGYSIGDGDESDGTYVMNLANDDSLFSSKDGVYYQIRNIQFYYQLSSSKTTVDGDTKFVDYLYSDDMRVTLKYTGINTDNAYTGTSAVCYVQLDSSDGISDSMVISAKVIELSQWGEKFKLTPGIGKSAILAFGGGEDLSLFGGTQPQVVLIDGEEQEKPSILRFELNSVTSQNGNIGNVAEIDIHTGNITLLNNYKIDEYYMSIKISCRYPVIAENEADYGYKSIGIINIAFKLPAE